MSLFRPITAEEREKQIKDELEWHLKNNPPDEDEEDLDEAIHPGLYGKNKLPWKDYVQTEEYMEEIYKACKTPLAIKFLEMVTLKIIKDNNDKPTNEDNAS